MSESNTSPAEVLPWPTAPNGDGSKESHWDEDSMIGFATAFFSRLNANIKNPTDVTALVREASDATNIPQTQIMYMIKILLGLL